MFAFQFVIKLRLVCAKTHKVTSPEYSRVNNKGILTREFKLQCVAAAHCYLNSRHGRGPIALKYVGYVILL